MTKITSSLLTLASLLAFGLSTAPAHALNTRSFISANGLDTNACTRTAPCRTLQKAHDSTNPGGEINMLDPAGYGTVTITKSISIVNDGVGSAGILVPLNGVGITINAGPADKVNLRGLIIEGAGVGVNGINFVAGKTLVIENCVIRNLSLNGIVFFANSISSSLAMSNTVVADNGNTGIWLQPLNTGIVHAALTRVEAYNNVNIGILADGTGGTASLNVSVADSVSFGNGFGVVALSNATKAAVDVMVLRSVIANNGQGLDAETDALAKLRVAQSAVTGNTVAWATGGTATLESYADNYIDGNGTGNTAPPAIAKK